MDRQRYRKYRSYKGKKSFCNKESRAAEFVLTEFERAREAALKLLDYQDRTACEMIDRLVKKGFDIGISQDVTDSLISVNLINDKRYAELYLDYAKNSGKGSRWIVNKLKLKGIAPEIIEEVMEEDESEETETVRCLRTALSVMGISRSFDIDEFGELIRVEEGEAFKLFCRKISDGETDKNVIYKEREKAKNSLARRLMSKGFSSSDVFYVIKKLDTI